MSELKPSESRSPSKSQAREELIRDLKLWACSPKVPMPAQLVIIEAIGALAVSETERKKPGTEAQILAAKIVVKKGEFADMFTASTAALLLATEILKLAYPDGVPTGGERPQIK